MTDPRPIVSKMPEAITAAIQPHGDALKATVNQVYADVMAVDHGDPAHRVNDALSGMAHVLSYGVVQMVAQVVDTKRVTFDAALSAVMGDIHFRAQHGMMQILADQERMAQPEGSA